MNVLWIAMRNLLRYRRRTLLTTLLITLGIVSVLLFSAVAGSFKWMMVGQITDAMLGHLQVHRRGYVASIDNLPLNLNLSPEQAAHVRAVLDAEPAVAAYTERVKFGAMFSNFTETTNIRLNAVHPEAESATVPLLADRLVGGARKGVLLRPGEILVPELLARGMKVAVGDQVVVVATNQDGQVNGMPLVVGGVLGSVTGPGGRDGYMRLDDARTLLRLAQPEVSEIAVRLHDLGQVEAVAARVRAALGDTRTPQGQQAFEVHTWDQLTPFANIAAMIDMLHLFIQIMLVSIVLISIMNVMVMAVYERIREIGTIAAIGTQPARILALFVTEGLLLGFTGAVVGTALSLGAIGVLNAVGLRFSFGRQDALLLEPSVAAGDVAWIVAVVVVVAVLASLQPAFKASRMDPIQALRHV